MPINIENLITINQLVDPWLIVVVYESRPVRAGLDQGGAATKSFNRSLSAELARDVTRAPGHSFGTCSIKSIRYSAALLIEAWSLPSLPVIVDD